MSRIKSRDTKLEKTVRAYLTSLGVHYRCNVKDLPGRPDIAIKKYKLALEVRGCFWHGHKNCRYFRLPKTKTGYWRKKINGNRDRDKRNRSLIRKQGFVLVEAWECEIKKGKFKKLDKFAVLYNEAKKIENKKNAKQLRTLQNKYGNQLP